MRHQKGFIQIPILIIVIIVIATSSVGAGVILHKQGKLISLVANISEVFKGTQEITTLEKEKVESKELQEEQTSEPTEEEIAQQEIDEDEIVQEEPKLAESTGSESKIQPVQREIVEPELIPEVEKAETVPEVEEPMKSDTCANCQYYDTDICLDYCQGTDNNCGCISCNNCNNSDGCSGNNYLDYYCSDKNCTFTTDNCSDCSCSCGGYNIEESIENSNCEDGKDNDCDGYTDLEDSKCFSQKEFIVLTGSLGGNITQNSKLTLVNSPYIVTETIQVLEGITLKIEPGVIIKFNPETNLSVGGELIVIGKENLKITFTSNKDNPNPGDWVGIYFTDKSIDAITDGNNNYISGSIIKYSIIEYHKIVRLSSSNPFISNNVFRNNHYANYSIYLDKSNSIVSNNLIKNNSGTAINIYFSNAKIINNTITDNVSGFQISGGSSIISKNIVKNNIGGFSLQFSANPIIKYNNIFNNRDYNINMAQNSDVQADHNYWGTTEISIIDESINDYYDNIGTGKILYQPIATSEIPDAGIQY